LFPLSSPVFQSLPATEKHPVAGCCHHLASQYGMCKAGDDLCLVFSLLKSM
jgi:hypothetical protein